MPNDADTILRFWFTETRPSQWFSKDLAFDAQVRDRFQEVTDQALAGGLSHWQDNPQGGLALVLLLDQFPRQIWRDTAKAFAGDAQALALTQRALDRGWVALESEQARRQFWLLPLMHAEDLAIQDAALPLFERYTDARTSDFARRHRDVIARFGRFPHRNAALGRCSSAAELEYIETPGSGF